MSFYTDEYYDELNEDEINQLLDDLADDIVKATEGVSVINVDRFSEMKQSYATLKALISDTKGAKISYGINKPFGTMGYITIEGRVIDILNTKLFVRAVKLANNMEVYPLTGNGVCMNLMFYKLTTKVE